MNPFGSTNNAMNHYMMMLFREAHSTFLFREKFITTRIWHPLDPPLDLKISPGLTVQDLISAETKMQQYGMKVDLFDALGLLRRDSYFKDEPYAGVYAMIARKKIASRIPENKTIQISFVQVTADQVQLKTESFTSGIFLFEALSHLGMPRLHHRVQDEHGVSRQLDQRIWESITITNWKQITALGHTDIETPVGGLSDFSLGSMAHLLIKTAQKQNAHFWMPAAAATGWFHNAEDMYFLDHWALSVLHGRLHLAIALHRHWILLECYIQNNILHVDYLDGQDHFQDVELLRFVRRLGNLLGFTTLCMTRHQAFAQSSCQTCGTIVLLHLGMNLGLWNEDHHPDELSWHYHIMQKFPWPGQICAYGKGSNSDDREIIWSLRDLLRDHGVPDERTEERAVLALEKIGSGRLREALASKNPWPALKSLGSQPKVNFMFVKPDELEQQIRRRAQAKFKIQPSDRKSKAPRPKIEGCDIDPTQLRLIEDTFVISDDDGKVKQLSMDELAAHKAGLAFSRVADVKPFLREGKSLSLDGLAVLTTSRVPPTEQGLLPVTNLRYPALYAPTQEPVLLEGSLINLGDLTIVRKQEQDVIATESVDTVVLKISVYRDEWQEEWATFIKSPLKLVFQKAPAFHALQWSSMWWAMPKVPCSS